MRGKWGEKRFNAPGQGLGQGEGEELGEGPLTISQELNSSLYQIHCLLEIGGKLGGNFGVIE